MHVDLVNGDTLGMTNWAADEEGGTHEIAVDVDSDRFFDEYFQIVS